MCLDFTPTWWSKPPDKIKNNPKLVEVWRCLNLVEELNDSRGHMYPGNTTVQWKLIFERWPHTPQYSRSIEKAYSIVWMQRKAGRPF